MRRIFKLLTVLVFSYQWGYSQTNQALNMSEVMIHNARFNPSDNRQNEIISSLDFSFLQEHLKTDGEKLAFWINMYNCYMLLYLNDTANKGEYTNFQKKKTICIAKKTFSLFDIEHEFIRLGKKNKALGFKKSRINKDTLWRKLRPAKFDYRAIFVMYRGLYAYPPFQNIENANIEEAYQNSLNSIKNLTNESGLHFDWLKKYASDFKGSSIYTSKTVFISTPYAVYLRNFYPKYEGIKFKYEDQHPWLK